MAMVKIATVLYKLFTAVQKIWYMCMLFSVTYLSRMMEDVLVKLSVGLLWLKLHSTRRGLFLLAHWTCGTEEEASEVLHLKHSFIWC
jgi:hypothetical protein